MLERLMIVARGSQAGHDPDLARLAAEFPTVALGTNRGAASPCVTVDLAAWTAPSAHPGAVDRDVEAADARGAFGLRARA